MLIELVLILILVCININNSNSSNVLCIHNCNGHGKCINGLYCQCEDGWGSLNDVSQLKAPDCSARVCPSGRSWAAGNSTKATAIKECSGVGYCDRNSGRCVCPQVYTGASCNRLNCPNKCSGHGHCYTLEQMSTMSNAFPLSNNNYMYGKKQKVTSSEKQLWDENMVQGCVCDSSWPVGLQSGQRQDAEWFGADCSLRHCPSGDDPMTTLVETNCTGINAHYPNSASKGAPGNLCHVDCSNRGICDYGTGICHCFNGFRGAACDLKVYDAPERAVDQTNSWQENNLFGAGGDSVYSIDALVNY